MGLAEEEPTEASLGKTVTNDDDNLANDPIMARFHSLVPMAWEFLQKRGQPGTHARAVELVEWSLAALREIGVHQAVLHLFYAAARNVPSEMDIPTQDMIAGLDAEGAAGFLRGEAAVHGVVTSGLLQPSLGELFRDDALFQSKGEDSIIGVRVQERKRQNRLGSLVDNFRARSVLRAHYDAGRDNCGWEAAHRRLFSGAAAAATLPDWNRLTDQHLRELARSAGIKAGRQQPLNEQEQAMEAHVLRYTTEEIANALERLRSGK